MLPTLRTTALSREVENVKKYKTVDKFKFECKKLETTRYNVKY